ncbi:MAG: VOC family protein [Phycisphaerales bacterium]|nr:VOC family protein [Phycisphaerales bacterium]
MHIAQFVITVKDYDEAIRFYVDVLGFELLEDTPMGNAKRWVRVGPPAASGRGCDILLARAVGDAQLATVGNQTGGRVFIFLHTDNFAADYERLKSKGVTFLGEPRREDYGDVVVFQDLYGNKFDLIGPHAASRA